MLGRGLVPVFRPWADEVPKTGARSQAIESGSSNQSRPNRTDCEDNPIGWSCFQAQPPVHCARPAGENRRLGRRAYGSLGPSADEVARIGALESPAADTGVPQLLKGQHDGGREDARRAQDEPEQRTHRGRPHRSDRCHAADDGVGHLPHSRVCRWDDQLDRPGLGQPTVHRRDTLDSFQCRRHHRCDIDRQRDGLPHVPARKRTQLRGIRPWASRPSRDRLCQLSGRCVNESPGDDHHPARNL